MATTDSNGVVFYEDTDPVSPLHTLLNLGQQGTTNALQAFADRRTATTLEYTPSANQDTAQSSTWTGWANLGSVVVPTWANSAVVSLTIGGTYVVGTGAGTNVSARLSIGSAASGSRRITHPGDTTGVRFDHNHHTELTNLSPGTQTVTLQGNRATGTGAYRIDTSASVSLSIIWQP